MRTQEVLDRRLFPRADAEVLLSRLLAVDRTWIIAHPEHELSAEEERAWSRMEERRSSGEPVAYILGEQEFYGRPFVVDRRVLIPRPATESLVDLALAWLREPQDASVVADAGIVVIARTLRASTEPIRVVADVGTGSGCIAVTLALERPDLSVMATDASEDALQVAKENASRLGALPRITFRHGNLMDPLMDVTTPFLLVANLPYVPSGRDLPRNVSNFEPMTAITAGSDGLDLLRPLVRSAASHPSCCGMLLECEEGQADALDPILRDVGSP